MPRTCTICSHGDKEAINKELVDGVSLRNIAKRFDTSAPSLFRHKQDHLPVALALAKEAGDIAQSDDLLSRLVDLQDKAVNILDKAEKAGDMRTALMAVREVRATMELVGKVTGELVNKQHVEVQASVVTFVIGQGYVDRPDEPEETVVQGEVENVG